MPVEDETGPCNGVKGAVDVYDPPLEARVPRLDRCCLKQKVGYSRDTAPKNNHQSPPQPLLCHEILCSYPPLPLEVSSCLKGIPGESCDSGLGLGLDARADLARVKNDLLGNVGKSF